MNRVSLIFKNATRAMTAFPLLLCFCISGCMVGPDFTRPEPAVSDAWVDATSEPTTQPTAAETTLQEWWTVFNDAKLTSLVQEAFRSNLDLQIATIRIQQARASRGIAASGIGPTVDASGSFRRSQAASGGTVNNYQTGFDAGWEIDIFGGVRRGIEVADAQLQTTVETRVEPATVNHAQPPRGTMAAWLTGSSTPARTCSASYSSPSSACC